jgi:hypothetical protein
MLGPEQLSLYFITLLLLDDLLQLKDKLQEPVSNL